MTGLQRRFLVGSVVIAALVVMVAGFRPPDDDIFFAIKKNLTIFGSLYEELAVGYVDPVDPEQLTNETRNSIQSGANRGHTPKLVFA